MRIFKKIFFVLTLLCVGVLSLNAQEFNAKVTVNTPKLQKADPKIFKTLQTAITQFFNDRKWTNENFKQEERIELTIQINIEQELSDTKFSGQMNIQSSRPVYNSSYSSPMLINVDKDFTFDYQEGDPLEYADNVYLNHISSLLAFYGYVVLGLDFDSFSELGGDDYFQKAQTVINNLPQNVADSYQGWKPFGSNKNRYWLIENILSARMTGMRRAMYQYHIAGLDLMYSNAAQGQINAKKAIDEIQKANASYPSCMWIQLFCNAKRDEIVNVFLPSDMKTKQSVFEIMVKLEPTQTEKYRQLMK